MENTPVIKARHTPLHTSRLNVQQLQQCPLHHPVTCCMLTLTLRELPQWSKRYYSKRPLYSLALVLAFLVDFYFPFLFRIADTACVRSDLSGLKYCYTGDVTQSFEKCVSLTVLSPSLQRYTDINIPNQQKISFLLIYFWVCVAIKYCLNLTVSYICVKSEKNVEYDPGCFCWFCSDCVSVDCLYRCWVFVVDCVLKWQTKSLWLLPFSKIVRHIFIPVNIIFYIWIVGLFNELQYNAMYFYIVSSFLFKDRDYFISR